MVAGNISFLHKSVLLTRRNTLHAESKLSGNTTSGLAVKGNSFPVDVVDIILLGVVVGVMGTASTGFNSSTWDTKTEETDVVRVLGELTRYDG